MRYIIPLFALLTLVSCKSKKKPVTENALRPAVFKFITTKSQSPYLVIRNVGNVSVKGSMPDQTHIEINKVAKAGGKKRAAEILDAIAFKPTLGKDGKVTIAPFYPKIKEGEHVATNIKVLIPLDMDFPVNVATHDGEVEIKGISSTVNLKVTGESAVEFRVFKGVVTGSIAKGKVRLGEKIMGGNLSIGKGELNMVQRIKEPQKDITITIDEGVANLQVISGLKMRYEIVAPQIVNNSSGIKLKDGKGGKGEKLLKVIVKKGKVVIKPELF